MKMKYLFLVGLILAIITIGAVSAADDGNALTVDETGDEMSQVEEIDVKSLLSERIKEKYNSNETIRLSLDLLDQLSKGNIEDSVVLSNDFFNNFYLKLDTQENKNTLDDFY